MWNKAVYAIRQRAVSFFRLAARNKLQCLALLIVALWCIPYITTGTKVEWGDFGIFTQGYEAIKVSILNYHQFPWWNAWEVGGAPLYGNPQLGVFSLQTIFVMAFGVVQGLKYAMIVYTFLGYGSMYLLLRRYFKIEGWASILLSLLWILCSFFVVHLPSHYTFLWYLFTPFYLYLALTIRNMRGGIYLGLAFAIMALSQIHNAFFQIGLVCSLILFIRLIRGKSNRKQLLYGMLVAAGVFLLLAGHRLIYTVQNVHDFPRVIADPAPSILDSIYAVLLPYSRTHNILVFSYPSTNFGWGEMAVTIGICATLAAFISLLFVFYQAKNNWSEYQRRYSLPLWVFAIGLFLFVLGCGHFSRFAPYNFLKHIPIFGNLRVSSRWFLGFALSLLIFIGLVLKSAPKRSFYRLLVAVLLSMGVVEMFYMNIGYQSTILNHQVVTAPKPITAYQFVQTDHFGETHTLPNGNMIPNGSDMPHFYREYEGEIFNTGVLQANDALIDLNTKPTPRCSWTFGCNMVQTGNAKITYWSPGKIVLQRTGPGRIELDMNDSNYFVINGHRNTSIRVAEPYKPFYLPVSDTTKTITIAVKPSPVLAIKHL